MRIEFQRLGRHNLPLPEIAGEQGLTVELRACIPEGVVRIPPGARVSIGTGFALRLPSSHAALLVPCSARAPRHGLVIANPMAVIPAEPGREVHVRFRHQRPEGEPLRIAHGTRIARLLIVERVRRSAALHRRGIRLR